MKKRIRDALKYFRYSILIEEKYLRICPYGKQTLEKLVDRTIGEVLLLSSLVTLILIMWNSFFQEHPGLYLIGSLTLGVYLVAMEVPNYKVQEKENRLYKELLIYFSRVKHRYLHNHHIPNAVLNAAEDMSYEIQRLAGRIYQILMECNRREKVREFVLYDRANRYMKLFLVQAYEASEKGDIALREEASLFSDNIEYLRTELMEEIYRRRRRMHELAGYTFVTVTPVFMMPVLKQWGMEFAPELAEFYIGTGSLIELLTFCTTVVVYNFINQAKEGAAFVQMTEKSSDKVSVLYRIPLLRHLMQKLEQQKGGASRKVREILLQSGSMVSYGELCVRSLLLQAGSLFGLLAFIAWIYYRKYEMGFHLQTEPLTVVLEILLCTLGSSFFGLIPLMKLWHQVQTARSGAVYEVQQFQSIVLMERRLQGITIAGLLEDMEAFSKVFKGILRKCINSYPAGPKEALQRLKEEGSRIHDGFSELADAFLSVDEVGIAMAFAEVENNRILLGKMTQLEAEISMERKRDSTDLLAKLPMLLTVGAYFVIPFFAYSLQGVYEVFELLEEMRV